MSVAEDKSQSHVVVVVVGDIDNANGCPRSIVSGEGSSETGERLDEEQRCCSKECGPEIVGVSEKQRRSSVSECCMDVDLDNAVPDDKVHLAKVERDCRICHLSMDMTNHDHESGTPIELGCSCKDDLAAAHKHCAEAWFKIKGNKTCEICGSIAHNVAGVIEVEMTEQWNETNDASNVPPTGPAPPAETRSFWQGHRFLNFLLACMVFAFVISWLFHFNVPS